MARRRKTKTAILLEYYGILCLAFVLRLLPLSICYRLASIAGLAIYAFDARHRKRAVQHLIHAGVAKNQDEARAIAKLSFENIATVAMETVKIDQLFKGGDMLEAFKFEYAEETTRHLSDPRGTIFVSAHFGNWEMMGLYGSMKVRPILSVMRPFDNPLLNDLVVSRRSNFKQRVCPKQGALKALLGALKRGESVAMLSDQHAGAPEGVPTVFFGHPAQTHMAPAALHLRTGTPLMLGVCRRIGRKPEYEVILRGPYTIEPSGDKEADIAKLTQMFTSDLEKIIAETPGQWVWCHRRWTDINR